VAVGRGGAVDGMGGSSTGCFNDVDLDGGLKIRFSSSEKGSTTDGMEGRSIAGGGPRAGNLGTGSGVLRSVRSLAVLRVLPLDFVLALDHIFSANDVALPILPVLFFGDNDGKDVALLCTWSCMYPNSLTGEVRVPNSQVLSGGVTAAVESSEEISDDVELL